MSTETPLSKSAGTSEERVSTGAAGEIYKATPKTIAEETPSGPPEWTRKINLERNFQRMLEEFLEKLLEFFLWGILKWSLKRNS